jgi:hypothetical protein
LEPDALLRELERTGVLLSRKQCEKLIDGSVELKSLVDDGSVYSRRISQMYGHAISKDAFEKNGLFMKTAIETCARRRFLFESVDFGFKVMDYVKSKFGFDADPFLVADICEELVREGTLLEIVKAGIDSDSIRVIRFHGGNAELFKVVMNLACNRLANVGRVTTEELYDRGSKLGVIVSEPWAHFFVDHLSYLGYGELIENALFAP